MSEKGPGKQGSSKSKAKKSLPSKQDAAESPCKSKTKGKGSSKAKPKATNKTLDEPYDSYLSEGVVSDGLKRGTFIKGTLRINPKKYQDAFVPNPDGGSDIYLPGLTMRNQALNGDVVVIDLLHRSQWKRKELEGEDDVTDDEKRFVTQKTGKVVFIVEKKHSRATTGFLKAYDKLDKTAIFSSVDHRLPRLLVPLADCPKEYLKTPSHALSNGLLLNGGCGWSSAKQRLSLPTRRLFAENGQKMVAALKNALH
ncbi:DIS3-like exonuclease 2 [Oscarella lobularis]|uniref:DIS3-like exonuclease 2 n=1 Tax=Oscarella lobularis TaxID=121494 RepID=UPI0033144436